ncbi:MAG: beta-N-acetylhexosaminidase [Gammaproteobacteria bacterium]|nr:beta-N-acetylhexosaminidase [Gammaproteobacteria bacterium]
MIDLIGPQLAAEERELLAHPLVGGVILFARNFSDPAQLSALCAQLAAVKRPRLLIAVDHEGGRVQRFRVGFTRIPAMRTFGERYLESPERALAAARDCGATIGRELGAVGVDLCFAPVLDRDCGVSTVIGDRAFDGEPQRIVELARAFRAGLNAAGLAATGKHFPGHGAVSADSHHELPVDRRRLAEIEGSDLLPFRALIEDGIESLMTAHVRYPAVDELPATFSRRWLRRMLRNDLHFNGALFCDDLSMQAAAGAGDPAQRAGLALEAGCDMLPVCNDRAGVVAMLDALPAAPRPLASARLARLYRRPG